jgi:hypothetical protein
MTWQEIAEKHGTDKATHGYIRWYEWYLASPQQITSILEIGCEKGNSVRMWREIFPDAQITVLDLFDEHPIPDIPGVEFIKGNQLDHEILYNLRNNRHFDVIIDDGSHNSRDQLITMYSLIGSSKFYVVEDLHCCRDEFYSQGLPFEQTILGQWEMGTFPFKANFHDKIAFIYAD